jgi:signal transduction histidine kinase
MNEGKILIIEDNPDLLKAYSRVLSKGGFKVLEADNGAEGLNICNAEKPDLVFLDAVLGDMDGAEVCRQIKASDELPLPFVVMISGMKSSPDYQAQVLENGADGFLQKPIDQKVLLANAKAMFRVKKAEADLALSKEEYRKTAEKLQEINQRLEEYNRLKAEFIANMSHELRTPLTAIIGFAQLSQLKSNGNLSPDNDLAFKRILRNSKHLLSLIDEVLDIAKIEAGRMKLHPDHFDIAVLTQDAFNEMQSLAEQKGLEYYLHIPDKLPFAFTDPVRIRQVMINLLSNAIKFTNQGSVTVTLNLIDDKNFSFSVKDTGIGIDADSVKYIFERFRQVDGAMTRTAGGTGLGLSIVKQLVELLGGRIEVVSEPMKGSEFKIILPLELSEETKAASRALAESEVAESKAAFRLSEKLSEDESDSKPIVLIIEDDVDMAALVAENLSRAGYRTHISDSGAEGLKVAREKEVSAILLDVMMPGMDGWKVLQALKGNSRTAEIPVIVCSIVDNRPLGYGLGASHYFVKPVEPKELTDVLQDIMPVSQNDADKENYVLVVDDEHGVRELLAKSLRRSGFKVRVASSGEIALKMISNSTPQAILCDLMMPGGMSGFELIARVRSNPQNEELPIIVITGKDMTSEDKLFIKNEIADVIRKGDLMMSDLETRLGQTLEKIGVSPINVKNINN